MSVWVAFYAVIKLGAATMATAWMFTDRPEKAAMAWGFACYCAIHESIERAKLAKGSEEVSP